LYESFQDFRKRVAKEVNIEELPSIYYIDDGEHYRILDDKLFIFALRANFPFVCSAGRFSPHSTDSLGTLETVPYPLIKFDYNSETRIIHFPPESTVFPKNIVDYANSIQQFNVWLNTFSQEKYPTCCMVNGLVKSGKKVAIRSVFPVLIHDRFPNARIGYANLDVCGVNIGREYIDCIRALFLCFADYLKKTIVINPPNLSGSAHVVEVEHAIRQCVSMCGKHSNLNFFILDEIQRLFQTCSNANDMLALFKSIVLLSEQGNLRFVFSGSNVIRAWHEILKCTANDHAPSSNIHLIHFPSRCETNYLALARELVLNEYPQIPSELLSCCYNPASISFNVQMWLYNQHANDPLTVALSKIQDKFHEEFIKDTYPLLKEITVKERKYFYDLTVGTYDNPSTVFPLFSLCLNNLIQQEIDTEGKFIWRFSTCPFAFFLREYLTCDGHLINHISRTISFYNV
ncbi:hypothetical protein ROZALSC1DRAFT_30802, partial [Rozella allomycis CSF55]